MKKTDKPNKKTYTAALAAVAIPLIVSLLFSDAGSRLLLNFSRLSAALAFPDTAPETLEAAKEVYLASNDAEVYIVEEDFDDRIVPSLPGSAGNSLFGTLPDLEAATAVIPEERRGIIEETTIASYGSGATYFTYGNGYIRNCTDYSSAEMQQAASGNVNFTLELDSGEPQVLIMHTHTTESYDRFDAGFYDSEYPYRTTDTELNVCAAGAVLAAKLNAAGINTLHATEFHDYPSYNNSYSRSAETVKSYLEQYPSIKIVIDVHRDGLERADGTRIKPVAYIGGQKAAQVMIIVGADDGTMDMPNFRENLKLGARIQNDIQTLYPGLARPLLFDYRHYNQDLTTGSILIEMGSHANTLGEALYSAELVGNALVKTFTGLSS